MDIVVGNGTSSIPLDHATVWSIGIFAAGIGLSLLVGMSTSGFVRGTAVAAPLVLLFFAYAAFEEPLGATMAAAGLRNGRPVIFAFLYLIIAISLFRASKDRSVQRALIFTPIVFLLSSSAYATWNAGWISTSGASATELPILTQRINVYHFLFDGLARPEVLQQKLGLTVIDSRSAFSARGFVVPDNVRAAYPSTLESVGSIFNQGQPTAPGAKLRLDESFVVRTFRNNGYSYGRYGEVFSSFVCSGKENFCLSKGSGLSEFDSIMISRTAIYPAIRRLLIAKAASAHLQANLAGIAAARWGGPTYFFSYMVPPHPPYIFSRECRADQAQGGYQAWDRVAAARYGWGYDCVIRAALDTVNKIINRDPKAIIIISGDHGTMFTHEGPNSKIWTRSALNERLPTFLAIRGPTECASTFAKINRLIEIYPSIFKCLARKRSLE